MIRAHWQTVLFGLTALGVMVAYSVLRPDVQTQVLMLAPLVAVLGLPHGALDLPIAEALWPLTGWRRKSAFVAVYLGLSGAVIWIWLVFPGWALAIFLCYSALHFSGDWAQTSAGLRWAGGAATIGAPACFHHQEVLAIFTVLAPQNAAALITDAAVLVGALGFTGLVVSCLGQRQLRNAAALEQFILWSSAAVLPPLMYFVVYFCALHSVRHFVQTMWLVAQKRRAVASAVTLSALVTLVAAVVWRYGVTVQVVNPTDQIIRIVFIGLAALTVPHMILVDRFFSGHQNGADDARLP